MFFYLITLGLAQILKETVPHVEPPVEGQSSNAQAVKAVEAWKHSDFLCHNYVLNGLIDPLYNVYCKTPTAKELWESLERKYKTEDAGTKKFVVARFLDYKMVDSKNVISQVQDLQVLIHDIHDEGMTLSETFQVAAIIEKLPPSWVDFKNYLKHKQNEISVEDLVVHIRPIQRKKGKDKRKNDKKSKGKSEYLSSKDGIVKHKFQWTCYNCDQPGHRAANCKMSKRVNPRQANMVNDDVDMIVMVPDACAMISEVNLVGTNHGGWWIDTEATRYVCADKSMFHSFKAVDNRQKLYMGNSATDDIKGEGDDILKMTSKKTSIFESDKFVLFKNQIYVGKGYAMNGMFKLNVMVVKNEINKIKSFAYLIESFNVWHGHLGHVNFNSMHRLIKFNSIPNFHIDSKYKCKTCIEAKLTRTSFKSVKQRTEPLDMVHIDICDLKSLPMKGGNKYFITFINICIKYFYVYLLKSKDEAIDKFVLYKTKVENQLGKKIKVVRSDRGGKYVSPFVELCAKHGIRHEFTAPYSPWQNGISKRKNRTLKEMVTAMLISSDKRQRDENDLQVEIQDQVEEVIEPRRGKRARTEKSFGPDFVSFMVENEPMSYREAVTSLEGHQWKEAIKSEIDSILQNHTWELVDLPPGCKPLGYKWIFKKKMKADGTIEKYKARMILAIAALRNLEVHQMDVKTKFLNGDLEEEIYMNEPEGFIAPG
nr:Pol polyprotein [Tanacetum cinerariifolium]